MWESLTPVWITIKLAAISTTILMTLCAPLAWKLSRMRLAVKAPIEAFAALPMALPPTVLGFYLLLALGPEGVIGGFLERIGAGSLAFTFPGLVIGSVIYSLPFVLRPMQSAFEAVEEGLMEAAATLGASPSRRFFTIALPLARPGFYTAAALGFAHTMGEFGVALMIGGNIPGSTRVVSIAIYGHVESMEYAQAHMLSMGLLVFSFITLLMISIFNRRFSSGLA